MRARALLFSGFVALVAVAPLGAQSAAMDDAPSERLQATTSSDAARTHLILALDERVHPFAAAARRHFEQALAADATMPLARAGVAMTQVGLTPAQRIEGIEQAIADGRRASAAELALMLSWRELVAGRTAAAGALVAAAHELAPGEPSIAFEHAIRSTVPGPTRIAALRSVIERFPTYGPAHNILAYQLYEAGDKPGALRHVREYMRHSPDHPNALDSYGEIMVWEGQLDEAERAYRRAFEVDPTFTEARNGLAEVFLARGRGDDARALFAEARAEASDAAGRRSVDYGIVTSLLFEGDVRAAERELERIGREAAEAEAAPAARLGYWLAAALAAHRDDRRAATRFMQLAAQQPGEPDASLPIRRVMAAPDDLALIRSTIAELQTASAAPNAPARYTDDLRVLRALEAARTGDFARAESLALEMPNVSGRQFVLGFVAEAMHEAGRTADARRVRDVIMSRPDFTLNGAFARAKVRGI